MDRVVRVVGRAGLISVGDLRDVLLRFFNDSKFSLIYQKFDELPTASDVDLLLLHEGGQLDIDSARKFVAGGLAHQIGLLPIGEAPLMIEGGRAVAEQLFAKREASHDLIVYRKGAANRMRPGAHHDEVPLPRQIYLGLTQTCNRSCSFCISRSFDNGQLSVEKVRELAEELRDSVRVIALTGAGEAMAHPDFESIVDLLVDRIPELQLKINTSGLSLPTYADWLVQRPFRNITISLNASTPETYERVVGRGFSSVLTGIRSLVRARALSGRTDLRLTLSMVLMNSTMKELPDFITRAFQLGVEEVQGIYLMVNGNHHKDESPWTQPERTNEYLDAAARRGAQLGITTSLPPRFGTRASVVDQYQPSSLPTTQGQRCVEPWSTAYVRPNGDVLSCPYSEESLGNVNVQSLKAIWGGINYQELRQSLLSENYWRVCAHCCGFNETGNVDDFKSHWLGERGFEAEPATAN